MIIYDALDRGQKKVSMKYYKKIEFANRIGVDRHTLNNWLKSGKLVPFYDEYGKTYYTEEQAVNLKTVPEKTIICGENWVDLSNVDYDCIRGRYDWKKACSRKAVIDFMYHGKRGTIILIDIVDHKLIIEIDGERKSILTSALLKVSMDKITENLKYDYKYIVGERIKIEKTDITILALVESKDKKGRRYKYRCNRCNQIIDNPILEYNIKGSGCCPICSGKVVVEGVNDIATTDSWMIPFFEDQTITRKLYHGDSTTIVQLVCPDCGKLKKKGMKISTLYYTRSVGCVCGDGFSYPNKFMFSVCEQLKELGNIESFKNEFGDEWSEHAKFDFIIQFNDCCSSTRIVEMDGGLGHGNKTRSKKISPEETKKRDDWKDSLAESHGFPVIRIDAQQSNKEYLKNNIIKALDEYCDFCGLDWEKADKFAISNYTKQVCKYYENHKPITIKGLAKSCHIGVSTALRYIKRGEEYGWCSYDWELYKKKKLEILDKRHQEKMSKVISVCDYYDKNKPILASEIAEKFGIWTSTVLNYLKEGETLGFSPYDKDYSRKRNQEQIKSISKTRNKRPVLCFAMDNKFIKRYESAIDAAVDYNVSSSAIHNCCRKKGTSAGYIFRYEDECKK